MISYEQFLEQMKRLHVGHDKGPRSESDYTRLADKVGEWFNAWNESCKDVSYDRLVGMVGYSINNLDKMPAFSDFKKLKFAIVDLQTWTTAPCSFCKSYGFISMDKNIPDYGITAFSYRCTRCENWRGKYDGLPPYVEEKEGFITRSQPATIDEIKDIFS